MTQTCLTFVAMALVASGLAYSTPQSWNSLLRSDLFPANFNSINARNSVSPLGQLKRALNNPEILSKVYYTYLTKYNKDLGRQSQDVFVRRVIEIVEHNLAYEEGRHSWTKGVNKFTDMTQEELQQYRGCNKMDVFPRKNVDSKLKEPFRLRQDPSSLDYRAQGQVTPVKNQGQCGSCWAFGSVAAVESYVLRNNNPEQILSEQELVDCDTQSDGCGGGYISSAYQFAQNNGIVTSSSYPYTSGQSKTAGTCQGTSSPAAQINSFNQISSEQNLQDMLVQYGVSTVGLTVGDDWYSYSGGVYNGTCGNDGHALAVVGYGNDQGNYWIIKNSWGTDWGENGYILLPMGVGECSIGQQGYYITS